MRACSKAKLGERRGVTDLGKKEDRSGQETEQIVERDKMDGLGQIWGKGWDKPGEGKKQEQGGGASLGEEALRNTGQMGRDGAEKSWREDETVSGESLEFEFGTGSPGAGSDEAQSRQRPQGPRGHSCSHRADHECPGSMCESMPACGWVCKCVCVCLSV